MYNNREEELVNQVKKLRRFFKQKVQAMPKQSLTAMKVAFGVRAQYATIALVATFMFVQMAGVVIFSGNARAVGTISYASSLTSSPSAMSAPRSVAVDSSGNVFVADDGNGYVRKFDSSGNYVLSWQVYTPTSYSVNSNESSMFLSMGANGNLYVAPNDPSIRNVSGNTLNIFSYDTDGNLVAAQPTGIPIVDAFAMAPDGTKFVIADGNLAVADFGSYSSAGGITASSDSALAIANSKIYIVDGGVVSIYDYLDYSLLNQYTIPHDTTAPTNPTQPTIAVDQYGYMYITDNSNVVKMSPTGQAVVSFGSTGTGNGQFINPGGVALGPSDKIYVADRYGVAAAYGTRVQVFNDTSFDLAVTTGIANGVDVDSAELRGSTNDADDVWSADYSIEYGTTQSYGSTLSASLLATTFQANATGLTCNTQYHYRAKGTANGITVYGSDATFTTGLCPGSFAITTTSLPNGVVGTGYSQTIATNSNGSPFIYVSSGALPDGLSLSFGGAITGTPTQAGTYTFTVEALDNDSMQDDNQEYTVTITDVYVPFAITTTTLPNGQVGASYSQSILTDSASPVTFSLASGNLPDGLSLSSAGVVSGTPTGAGSFSFGVSATDTISTDTQALEIVIESEDSGDPEVTAEDPATPVDEAPTITDVTPPTSTTPAAKVTKTTPILSYKRVVATQNTLFALAKRIPEPFAIGFPWLLLLLALILVGVQYYQVHAESLATKRAQASLANQQRLAEEQNNFVALSTHYLHTPLTVMEGEISLMVKAGTLTQAQATKLTATLSSLSTEAEAILAQEEQQEEQHESGN